ncbi:hypothetical protein K1719_037322 [Acacia pycnantha]|nr:hypothetical protein K1719_037322 [Acacia pycnantha]
MSERKESYDGDGRERGDGDGGSRSKGKEVNHDQFVFGRTGSSGPSKVGTEKEKEHGARRPISLSYKEKLLSPGSLGYLVTHAEEDDIVSGWRGYFSRRNDEKTTVTEDAENTGQGDVGVESARGYPVLSVTSEQYTSWCRPWMNSLVIKLLGLSVPKHVLIDRVSRMWRPRQPLKVVPLSHEYYIVSFSSMEDRDYALYEGPWMIDRSTSIYDKGEFARICVEVDLQQPLLPAFTALGEDKQLVYEGLHLVCFRCGLYGHDRRDCPQLNVAADVDISIHRNQKMATGVDEATGVPTQAKVDGGDNCEGTKQSRGEGGGEKSGHPKERGVNIADESEGSKQASTPEGSSGVKGGLNTVVGVGDGGAPMVGKFTARMEQSGLNESIKVEAKLTRNDFGSSKHLGPQMILKRDLRRSNPILAKNPAMKNTSPGFSLGRKKEGVNHGISRSGSNGLKKSDVGGADLMGSPIIPLKEKEKNKEEWVVVGSKRKKNEKPKKFGKENKIGGRPKLKPKEEEPSSVVMTNGFATLHDLGPNINNVLHGDMQMDDGQQSGLGENSTHGVDPSHEACDAGKSSIMSMGDAVVQRHEQDVDHGNLINGVGSGLAPPTFSTSYQ